MLRNTRDAKIRVWESLLKAVRENGTELAGIAPLLEALARSHAEAVAFRGVREGLRSSTQDATQRLNAALAQGQEAAECLRGYIKSVLGPRSEMLARYGMKPRRKRSS
jgi:hypothetical protein